MSRLKTACTAFLSGLFFIGNQSDAQTVDELITDRPDITESAVTVTSHAIQIESGFLFQRNMEEIDGADLKSETVSIPGILLRYGVFPFLELRAGTEYLFREETSSGLTERINGINGILLGTKVQLLRDEQTLPDAAVLLHFNLPLGNKNLKPEKVEPEIILALSHPVAGPFSISYNIGSVWQSPDEVINYFYSGSLAIELAGKIGMFTELFGSVSPKNSASFNIDAGLAYLLHEDLQVDLSSGLFLRNPSDNWFIGTGISFRIRH
ncbi:MAG TPA: transporter [Ignavibacteriaceae bacterium]|nr:transporter [Ignavibacteriaceae bacterium]